MQRGETGQMWNSPGSGGSASALRPSNRAGFRGQERRRDQSGEGHVGRYTVYAIAVCKGEYDLRFRNLERRFRRRTTTIFEPDR